MKNHKHLFIGIVSLFTAYSIGSATVEAAPRVVTFSAAADKTLNQVKLPTFHAVNDPAHKVNQQKVKKTVKDLIFYTNINLTLGAVGKQALLYKDTQDLSAAFDGNYVHGGFSFNKGMKKFQGDNTTPDLLTGAAATKAALGHLKNLNLLPANSGDIHVLHVGGVAMAKMGDPQEYKKLTTVHFGRTYKGIKVMGASRARLSLGSKGELVALTYNWRKMKESKHALGAMVAKGKLKDHVKGKILKHHSKAAKFTVDRAELVMFDDGEGFFEPAFHVEGNKTYGGANSYTKPYDMLIPALNAPKSAKFPHMKMAKKPASLGDGGASVTPKDNE